MKQLFLFMYLGFTCGYSYSQNISRIKFLYGNEGTETPISMSCTPNTFLSGTFSEDLNVLTTFDRIYISVFLNRYLTLRPYNKQSSAIDPRIMAIIYYSDSIPNDTLYLGEHYGIQKNGILMKNDVGLLSLIKDKIGWGKEERQEIGDRYLKGNIYQIMELDTLPSFKGGYSALLSYINQRTKYPEIYDMPNGGKRELLCRLVIGAKGNILYAQVVDSPDNLVNEQVLKILKNMPKWIPGRRNGEAVTVDYYLPITISGYLK